MTDTLLDALDESWRSLLLKFTVNGDDGKPTVPIGQQIEALVAAAKWSETRAKLIKPTLQEPESGGKFEGIKDAFHGKPRKPWRPGGPGRPPSNRETVGGTASAEGASDTPAPDHTINGAEPANGDASGAAANPGT
jgi:hypothetical protein